MNNFFLDNMDYLYSLFTDGIWQFVGAYLGLKVYQTLKYIDKNDSETNTNIQDNDDSSILDLIDLKTLLMSTFSGFLMTLLNLKLKGFFEVNVFIRVIIMLVISVVIYRLATKKDVKKKSS